MDEKTSNVDAFGMLASKFEIFQRPIMCHEDTAIKVIKAACILHNFIKMVEGHFSVPQISENQENQCTNREMSQSTNDHCSITTIYLPMN